MQEQAAAAVVDEPRVEPEDREQSEEPGVVEEAAAVQLSPVKPQEPEVTVATDSL